MCPPSFGRRIGLLRTERQHLRQVAHAAIGQQLRHLRRKVARDAKLLPVADKTIFDSIKKLEGARVELRYAHQIDAQLVARSHAVLHLSHQRLDVLDGHVSRHVILPITTLHIVCLKLIFHNALRFNGLKYGPDAPYTPNASIYTLHLLCHNRHAGTFFLHRKYTYNFLLLLKKSQLVFFYCFFF